MNSLFRNNKVLSFLASVKMAVIIIIGLATISAVGTIYEARFDAEVAQKLVYKSVWMYIVMGTLCVNLIAVMASRWPWKPRHTGFLLAHIGIITTLVGSVLTQRYGVDGSMSLQEGGSNRYVSVSERELAVYASLDGQSYRPLHQKATDFFMNPPEKEPLKINIGSKVLEVTDYHHYAIRESKIVPSEKESDGPAVRFQLQNERVNMSRWLNKPAQKPFESINLGPARVTLATGEYVPQSENEIVLKPIQGEDKLAYEIHSRRSDTVQRGEVTGGDMVETGWMGLQLRVLRYMPEAREEVTYQPMEKPTPITTSAIKVTFDGEDHWIGVNSLLRLFTDDAVYVVSYGNRRLDVGVPLTLKDFRIGRYQGTMRAASYESEVSVPELGDVVISMNEPLKHKGFTFYQASFEQDASGQPTASILSVNYDPGRPLKYLGSFIIVLGSIILFYFKRFKLGSKSKKVNHHAERKAV